MPIIQFVMPSRNKQLKKLLHSYWEVRPKYDENEELKQEMTISTLKERHSKRSCELGVRNMTFTYLVSATSQ